MNRRHLLVSLLALGGCGLSERPHLEKRDWPLKVSRPQSGPAAPRGRVLLVRTVQAGPGLETRGLSVLQPDGSVKTEFYEAWSVPPAEGAEASLREWLSASGRFAAVLAPGSRMNADLILEATLTALIADPAKGLARAAMSIVVLDQRGGGGTRVAGQSMIAAEAPLAGTDAPARVAAMRAALAQVLEQVEAALAGTA
jgi:ABC-type uncharacterized transport system auxiliary subunit